MSVTEILKHEFYPNHFGSAFCCVSAVECYLTYHGSVKLGILCENTSNMSFTKCVD